MKLKSAAVSQLGLIATSRKNYSKAVKNHREAIALLEELDLDLELFSNVKTLCTRHYNYCAALITAGQLDEALVVVRKGLELSRKLKRLSPDSDSNEVTFLNLLSAIYLGMGKPKERESALKEAVQKSRELLAGIGVTKRTATWDSCDVVKLVCQCFAHNATSRAGASFGQ